MGIFGKTGKDTLGQLNTLFEVSGLLASTLEPKEVRRRAMEAAVQLLDCEASSLLLLDEEKEELYFEVALGKKGERLKELRLKMGEGIAGWVAKSTEPLLIHDVSKDPRFSPKGDSRSRFVTKNMVAVPVMARGKLLGVLEAINKHRGVFYKQDLELLQMLANQVAIAIENARLYEAIQETFLESAEANKMLGLTFQSKGMLELAYERFKKVSIDRDMLDILYNLATDFERKRMAHHARRIYEDISEHDPGYKDIQARIERLRRLEDARRVSGSSRVTSDSKIVEAGEQCPTSHEIIGRYNILEQIGTGSLGSTHKARDPKLSRDVVIKAIRYPEDLDEGAKNRLKGFFVKELEEPARLIHPAIVTIYDVGDDWDMSYMAMEYLDGESLEVYCNKERLLPLWRFIQVALEVTGALAFAHKHGVVHLGIKPSNIIMLADGRVKLTDFRISRIAEEAAACGIIGTCGSFPAYKSPELVRGEQGDHRSDIFSLGVVLYSLLTGERPFDGVSVEDLEDEIQFKLPPSPAQLRTSVPEWLSRIIEKAMLKGKDRRFQTASEMEHYLKTVAKQIQKVPSRWQVG